MGVILATVVVLAFVVAWSLMTAYTVAQAVVTLELHWFLAVVAMLLIGHGLFWSRSGDE